jgi:hypothetical protein
MADQPIPTSDPSQAQAVQIPLQSFTVPTFPPEALAAPIQALTLTSDINLSEYHDLLSKPFEPIPELPASIESLTLELFTLGYPAGFLTQLAARLPRLKGLTVFGQLIGGVEDSQGTDAEGFFESIGRAGGLREIHFIDAFGKAGFWERVGGYLNPAVPKATENGKSETGLHLLEISYTYRHSDEEFLTRIHAADLLALVQPSLVAASFNISPPPPKAQDADERVEREDPENLDPEGKMLEKRPEGVMVLHPTHTPSLMEKVVEKWEGEKGGLKMLALTLFTLDTKQIGDVLGRHGGLRVLNVTVSVDKVEGWRGQLMDVLGRGEELEVVEVVVSPGLDFYLQVGGILMLSVLFCATGVRVRRFGADEIRGRRQTPKP